MRIFRTLVRSFLGCMLVCAALSSAVHAQEVVRYDDMPDAAPGVSSFTVFGTRWDRTNLTFAFANATPDLAVDAQRQAFRQALDLWASITPLRFVEVAPSQLPDILVSWQTGDHGDGNPFDGLSMILAHAFFPPPNGSFAGDIHFDESESWTALARTGGAQPIDLLTVAAHEIGHSLGLGHSGVAGALMAPFYSGSHRFLSPDDVNGAQFLYGRPLPDTLLFDVGALTMSRGDQRVTQSRILVFQGDSNLVLYANENGRAGRVIWQSRTAFPSQRRNFAADRVSFQANGNFVVAAGSNVLWSSETAGRGRFLVMQNDGRLVIYDVNWRPVWVATN